VSVSILDLTGDQTAWIEDTVGVPVDDWGEAPKGRLFPLILAAAEGTDELTRDALVKKYGALKLGELLELVSFDEPEGKGPSGNGSQGSLEPQAGR